MSLAAPKENIETKYCNTSNKSGAILKVLCPHYKANLNKSFNSVLSVL